MEDKDYPQLTRVKKAENHARSRIVGAESEAKNELRAARERAKDIIKSAEKAARENSRQRIEDARYKGEGEAQEIIERRQSDIEALKKKAGSRMQDACKAVVRRIKGTP